MALQKDKFLFLTKPHGHSDIHYLLKKTGLIQKWINEGKIYFIQFMNINDLAFNCVLSAIEVSVKYNNDINSKFLTRRSKEKIDVLYKIIDKNGKVS